jgi:hypothetical protein
MDGKSLRNRALPPIQNAFSQGYSANDPVMRYMLDAFASDRVVGETDSKAFAFVPAKSSQDETVAAIRRSKGVEPIVYTADHPKHERLHATLRQWSSRHELGCRGRAAIVIEHASNSSSPGRDHKSPERYVTQRA